MNDKKLRLDKLKKGFRETHWGLSSSLLAFRWWLVYFFLLWPIRIFFGWVLPPLLKHWWHNQVFYHYAQDDCPVYEGVRCIADEFPYGPHFRETMDVIVPDSSAHAIRGIKAVLYDAVCLLLAYPRAVVHYFRKRFGERKLEELAEAKKHNAMLFIHGGGWCAVDASIQHHQSTVFSRKGFSVYTTNYPHAPESPFPSSTISTLRALHFLRDKQGHESVTIIGESAGGNLATVVAALVCNRHLLEAFCERCYTVYGYSKEDCDLLGWTYPKVLSVTSWYGILDTESWRHAGWLWFGLDWCYHAHIGVSPLPPIMRLDKDFDWALDNKGTVARLRREQRHADPFITLTCMFEASELNIKTFPPCLLLAGSADPLGLEHSSLTAFQRLKEAFPGRENDGTLQVEIKNAGHAYIGLNPFVLYVLQGSGWRQYAQHSTYKTCAFILKEL